MAKIFLLSMVLGFTLLLTACESDPLTTGTAASKAIPVLPPKPQTLTPPTANVKRPAAAPLHP